MFTRLVIASLATAALLSPAESVRAQQPLGTVFTYQGELRQGGNPANGSFDLRFTLYDALAGGMVQGASVCVDNAAVVDGRFTAQLDFGAQFNGQRRFLQIEVRPDTGTDCSTGSGYTALAPRQELAAAPYAMFALSTTAAANATQLNGQAGSFYTNASNITSGTLSASRLPVPLGLTGNPPSGSQEVFGVQNTHASFGVGIRSTAPGIGLISNSTAINGLTFGGQFFSASSDGTALLAHATSTTGTNVGISAKTSSADGVAIAAEAEHPSGPTTAIIGSVASPQGYGVYGIAPVHALFGQAYDSGGRGIETIAPADGYAGYFNGRGYFSDRVGVGTTAPASGLHVVRNWDGENGALHLEGDRPSLRLTGGPVAGSESWLMHVGNDGPGNLGFHRRAGASTWTPVVTLSPTGNVGIGTNGPGRPLHVSGSSVATARFASGNSTANAVEFQNTTSNAIWEYGVSGSTPPFPGLFLPYAVIPGSMYIYKQGEQLPALMIDPSSNGSVRVRNLQAITVSAGFAPLTDAVAVSGRGNSHGVFGACPSNGTTFYGVYGVASAAATHAVFADGKLTGNGTKSFRIDHPADPQNKFLTHYCAESPEVINFYSGTVMLDS